MSDEILIANLDIEALAVGQGDLAAGALTLPPMADFEQLYPVAGSAAYISQTVLGGSQPFGPGVPLARGIHLHWSLPRQLTRGASSDTGMKFPGVPDRWLVTRIVVQGAGLAKFSCWVVESDRLGDTSNHKGGPLQPNIQYLDEKQATRLGWIGQATPALEWKEIGKEVRRAPRPFTALGYGEPSFAAFYPNCSSVFGFHDALTDVDDLPNTSTTISYQVSGWYANLSEDPLANASAATLADWQPPSGPPPGRLICAGMLDGIVWKSDKRYLDDAPKPLTVAIAGTSREALSALLATGNDEALLNALQFGLLADADSAGGSPRGFEEDVHDAGFATLSGGNAWSVELLEDKSLDKETPQLPTDQATLLAQLNAQQARQNDLEQQRRTQQAQLFLDWQKYQMQAHDPDVTQPPLKARLEEIRTLLRAQVADITALLGDIAGQRTVIEDLARQLEARLDNRLVLSEQTGAPRFYQPTEPVLLLAGKDAVPPERHAPDCIRSDRHGGRLASQMLRAAVPGRRRITIAQGQGQENVRWEGGPTLPLRTDMPLAKLLKALVAEAMLVSPALRPHLEKELGRQLLETGQFTLGRMEHYGLSPGPGYYRKWSTPWLPFLLHYEIELSALGDAAAGAGYPDGFIQQQFRFGFDALDLEFSGKALGAPRLYQGSTLLAADATLGITREIERFETRHGEPILALGELQERIERLPLLAQNLSGFNDALLMQRPALQLPVDDPLDAATQAALIEAVSVAVGSSKHFTPLPQASFKPLRAELLQIRRLRLVDVFGRFKDYPKCTVRVAKGMQPPPDLPQGAALLAPRITQPARLQFRWRAATRREQESADIGDNGPVLGWVIPNHLERSLMLHAANGKPLGKLVAASGKVQWTCAPLGDFKYGTALETVLAQQPADLLRFAKGFHDGERKALDDFLGQVNYALQYCLPDQFAETAEHVVLSGQPLVLARASLALELAGAAAKNQSWASLEEALDKQPVAGGKDWTDVRFPIRLGALNRMDDTLVGYWIDPQSPADYGKFNALYHEEAAKGERQDSEALTLAADGMPREVVLLLDPRGSVHASSGILPVKNIDIPPRQYASALASLDVSFDCLPVLTGSDLAAPASMVLPRVASGKWHWLSRTGEKWGNMTPTEINASKASLDYRQQRIAEGWLSIRRDGGEKTP